jgi:hypothetical protein
MVLVFISNVFAVAMLVGRLQTVRNEDIRREAFSNDTKLPYEESWLIKTFPLFIINYVTQISCAKRLLP